MHDPHDPTESWDDEEREKLARGLERLREDMAAQKADDEEREAARDKRIARDAAMAPFRRRGRR